MLMEDNEVIEQPIKLNQLSDKLTAKSVEFIQRQKNKTEPFALYHAFASVHTPLRPGKKCVGQSQHGAYGDRYLTVFVLEKSWKKAYDST